MVQKSTHCLPLALSGSAPLGALPRGGVSVWRRGHLVARHWAAEPSLDRLVSPVQKGWAQRRTQFQRLRDGPAGQTADEVRRVVIQRAFLQAVGISFKTKTSLPSTRAFEARHPHKLPLDGHLHGSLCFCLLLHENSKKDDESSVSVPLCCFGSAVKAHVSLSMPGQCAILFLL